MISKVIKLMFTFLLFSTLSFSSEKIEILLSTGYPPYYFYDENGIETGICVDLVNAAAKELNIKIKYYRNYPWKRCLSLMERGEADAFFPLFKTTKREEFLIFNEGNILSYEEVSFFKKINNPISYSGDLKELTQYSIGTVSQYSYGTEFDSATYLKKEEARNELIALKMLIANRTDLFIGDRLVISAFANKENMSEQIEILRPILEKSPLYLAFSVKRDRKELAEKFAKKINELKENGTYDKIINKYIN